VLGVLLPAPRDLPLLQACLGDAATARAAWHRWRAAGRSLPRVLADNPRARRLLALLHRSLVAAGVEIDPQDRAILRAATLWEEHRAARVRSIAVSILQSLRHAGIEALLTRGVAMAWSAYPEAYLRHAHDVDVAVRTESLGPAHRALAGVGFRAVSADELRHVDGLPVRLHADWSDAAWRRSRSVDFEGEAVRLPSPLDSLLKICGHTGPGIGADNWVWIADAAMVLRSHAFYEADWRTFTTEAEELACLLPLSARYIDLARRFGVSIPSAVLARLVSAAWRAPRDARAVAILAAKQAARTPAAAFLKTSGWHSRFEILRWAARR
jgi:hypothetical protein